MLFAGWSLPLSDVTGAVFAGGRVFFRFGSGGVGAALAGTLIFIWYVSAQSFAAMPIGSPRKTNNARKSNTAKHKAANSL
ncbi:hypothetical protein OFM52_30585, partial [Escherichia coli]|nr:hypothetical protein [Escherichia coli]